jgi:hypothetical protein
MLNPVDFTDVTLNIPVNDLNPNLSYCIVIRGAGDVAGKVRYQVITGPGANPKGPDDGHGFLYSDNGGTTWSPDLLKDRYLYDCFFTVNGIETETTVTSTTTPTQVIEGVEVELQNESVLLESEVKLPNI